MTTDQDATARERVETALNALEKRDAVAAASTFAEDGEFVHPLYPATRYSGRETIRGALEWALANVADHPRFTIRYFLARGGTCAVEVETRCVAKDGREVELPQVFLVEVGEEGIAHWRTYLPFPPE